MEVTLFHRQRKSTTQTKAIKDLIRIVPAAQILAEEKRQALLQRMQDLSGLDPSRYASLCTVLIEHFVSYCQSLPETANSYYAQQGGLVDHALNRTEAALSLFKEFMVLEQDLSEEQKLWQYALYSAAILQGVGKLFIDFKVNLFDTHGQLLKPWNPLLESMIAGGRYYDYEFEKESDIEFRRRLNLLLARTMIPLSGFTWIASEPRVLAVWLALLNEDNRSAGTLGAILSRSDAIAINRYFAEFMNKTGVGRTSRYRAGTFTGGVPETIAEKEQAAGIQFIHWLNNALKEGTIMINKAPLFMVPGGMLMSQEMFQLFIQKHPEFGSWQSAQKGFLSLGLHAVGADGAAINRFESLHDHQMHSGVVFSQYALALPDTVKVYDANSGKVDSMSAIELIHNTQLNNHMIGQNVKLAAPLQKLGATGQWQNSAAETPLLGPGAKRGG